MKYLVIFCLLILCSCTIVPGYYSTYTTSNPTIYTYPYTYSYNYYRPFRPAYLGNVYYNPRPNHHHHVKTNLPLHNGPIGGRRK